MSESVNDAPETAQAVQTTSDIDNVDSQPQELSKSARKKLAKAAYFQSTKLERRAREKEAKKEKKRILKQKRDAGELDSDEEEKLRQKKKPKVAKPDFNGRVVIDLGFDDKMQEKEIKSLCSQLAYTYSANRNASYPFTLLFTRLNARTKERLEKINDAAYRRWSSTEWWEDEYDRLWASPAPSGSRRGDLEGEKQEVKEPEGTTDSQGLEIKKNVVYLTADADEELEELKEDETYIIGGICDHNRYKNLCLDKARDSGIRAARLPIGRYLAAFPTRKVLTVNQVFEILVHWVQTKDWYQALMSVMPKRKFQDNAEDKVVENEEQAAEAIESNDASNAL
jgi:tRNA (guanine9-N1)-methyltransferase